MLVYVRPFFHLLGSNLQLREVSLLTSLTFFIDFSVVGSSRIRLGWFSEEGQCEPDWNGVGCGLLEGFDINRFGVDLLPEEVRVNWDRRLVSVGLIGVHFCW